MVNRSKKNKFTRIFANDKFLTLVGLVAIILISFPFAKNALKQYRLNNEINGFRKEIVDLQNKNSEFKKAISYLGSDQFAEEQARLNLNLKKPGEELTIIKNGAADLSQTSTAAGNSIFNFPGYNQENRLIEPSNREKWFNYFFKRE
jgi:cell division protein FtsB